MRTFRLSDILQGTLLACLMALLLPAATAQIDTLHIYGTAIDTSKVYDGTDLARIITLGELPPLTHGTQVNISGEAHYSDANAGLHKAVTVSFSISGPDAVFYAAPADTVIYADILPRRLEATETAISTGKTYDGNTSCEVTDPGRLDTILEGDTVWQTVTAEYASRNFAYMIPVTVTHSLYGPQAANYYVEDAQHYFASIVRRHLTATEIALDKVKEYDGSDTVHVLGAPVLVPVVDGDNIGCIMTATFDSPEPGHGKTITGHFALTESDADNYAIEPDSVIATDGAIIMPTEFILANDGESPMEATAYGFCQGEQVQLRYRLSQGEPVSYSVIHPQSSHDLGFTDMIGIPCTPEDTLIAFPLPAGCPGGIYPVEIQFRNEAQTVTSVNASFRVNLPNSYLVQVFDDVISIDNRSGEFISFHWLHNGEFIDETKPYHQEIGGLTGSYAVLTNEATADEAMVCPMTAFVPMAEKPVVTAMPSPVTDATTLKLQGFQNDHHSLQLFNSHGILVYTAEFDGRIYHLDMSALPQGAYLITVDGTSVKTLKL